MQKLEYVGETPRVHRAIGFGIVASKGKIFEVTDELAENLLRSSDWRKVKKAKEVKQ